MTGATQDPARTILIVDDDALIRIVAAEYFARQGFGVYQASNATAAFDILARANPAVDVVLSDVAMPEKMDGIHLCQQIMQHWPHIPVLLASGNELPDGANAPAAHFFLKPYRLTNVHRTIDALLPPTRQ
jgi:DNA-binding NtrC family response regulator